MESVWQTDSGTSIQATETDLPFGFVHFSPRLSQPADGEVVETSHHRQEGVVGMEVKQVLWGKQVYTIA